MKTFNDRGVVNVNDGTNVMIAGEKQEGSKHAAIKNDSCFERGNTGC